MLSSSSRAIKYLLFTFNLVFVMTGVILVGVGLTIKSAYHEYEPFLDDRYFSAPSILITTGAFVFAIAFFGCCGAIKEHHCMVMTFSVMLGTVFVVEMIVGVTGYTLSENTADVLTNSLEKTMKQYNTSVELTALWDGIQSELKCCGVHNASEWETSLNGSLPVSCCGPQVGAIGHFTCDMATKTLYHTPCLEALGELIRDNAILLSSVGIGIALVQLVGIVFACNLARSIRNNYETV